MEKILMCAIAETHSKGTYLLCVIPKMHGKDTSLPSPNKKCIAKAFLIESKIYIEKHQNYQIA
jgi:hypothetical protein